MSRKRNANNHRTKTIDQPGTETATGPQSSSVAESKIRFLGALQLGVSVAESARWVGIPRTTLYRWRRNDPEFARAWDDPDDDSMVISLEFEAFKRALNGNDRLLILLLKSYHPDMFDDRRRNDLLAQDSREERAAEFIAQMRRFRQQESAEAEHTPSGVPEPGSTPSSLTDPLQEESQSFRGEVSHRPAVALGQPDTSHAGNDDAPTPDTMEMAHPCATRRPSIRI